MFYYGLAEEAAAVWERWAGRRLSEDPAGSVSVVRVDPLLPPLHDLLQLCVSAALLEETRQDPSLLFIFILFFINSSHAAYIM